MRVLETHPLARGYLVPMLVRLYAGACYLVDQKGNLSYSRLA